MKKMFLLIFVFMLVQANFLFAESTNKKVKISPEAEEVVKKILKASKTEKMKDLKNLTIKFKMNVPTANISGDIESTATQTKVYTKVSMAGYVAEQGYNGTVSWAKDLMQGIRDIAGQERESLIQSALINSSDIRNYYDEIQLAPDEKFNDKDCNVLICKKSGIADAKVFVDKTSNFVIGSISEQDIPEGKMTTKMIIDENETTKHGFVIPKKMTVDMGIAQMTMTVTEVIIDGDIDEKIFEKPEK